MYIYFKRLADFLIGVFGLILFSPLFLIIALCIKLESPGPVFFVQQRVGIHGQYFTIYKFRTMKLNTPNVSTDRLPDSTEYVTRLGKFLRKGSLDELPQLLNLLLGNMSFVGPRPALYNQYELIADRERCGVHRVYPGITGYAQVMGRDFITDEQKVEYDKYYVDHLSPGLDLKIVWMTVFKVIKAEDVKDS